MKPAISLNLLYDIKKNDGQNNNYLPLKVFFDLIGPD